MNDLGEAEFHLETALAIVRRLQSAESIPRDPGNSLEAEVADRVRVMGIMLDADGALPCNRAAMALGHMPTAMAWHCRQGSGPKQLHARRGHRHRLADAIAWERAQRGDSVTRNE